MTTFRGVISYPIPAYQNVPIHAEYFKPREFDISAIDLGYTTIITSLSNLDYVIGQEIRLLIPANFGIIELNGMTGIVLSLPSETSVEVDINSINMNEFILATPGIQSAQILGIGDINNGYISKRGPHLHRFQVTVPGAFKNISPL